MSIKEKLKTNTYMPHLDMYTEKKNSLDNNQACFFMKT